ncbi:hypothetical protein CH373_03445 [Leptospira perolatii]|uniref:DUF5683 domain-containing protein n=2 Tax=Leptospira perolatii TaxID=2023191 RepID=A0A2M9ZT34_9LEPT|nr:hypothetical protein CH360_14325 [Leptospira perolatii]PJZ75083.1 hypothetical protein CH373_03445 [Leptospira perolatii]
MYSGNKLLLRIKANQTALLYIILLITSTSLFGETIILRNGKSFKGKVIKQSEKTITVQDESNQVVEYRKTQILKVVFKDISEIEAKKIHEEEERKLKEKQELEQKKEEVPPPKIEEPKKPLKPRWDLTWRSAVFPGWGQYHGGYKKEAKIDAIVFWSLAAVAVYAYYDQDQAKKKYQNNSGMDIVRLSISDLDPFTYSLLDDDKKNFQEYHSKVQNFNIVAGLLTLWYIGQLGHAYIKGIELEAAEHVGWNFQAGMRSASTFYLPKSINGAEYFGEIGYTFPLITGEHR